MSTEVILEVGTSTTDSRQKTENIPDNWTIERISERETKITIHNLSLQYKINQYKCRGILSMIFGCVMICVVLGLIIILNTALTSSLSAQNWLEFLSMGFCGIMCMFIYYIRYSVFVK